MKIGMIDVDGHHYPNLPLMKLSAWHKQQGDTVEWYDPLLSGHMDIVYKAKVFSFTPDYAYAIDADQIIQGGTGYHINLVDGVEKWGGTDMTLPDEVEHIYPDYSLYNLSDRSLGFLSRGCPRQCLFCHVKSKEGTRAHKVADLTEFWHGQKEITIMDPNILAVPESEDLLGQLAESKAKVDINQGLDARLLTPEKIEIIKKIRIKTYHFAWDNPADEDKILPKLQMFSEMVKVRKDNTMVYCLVNFNSSLDMDLYRIYKIKRMHMQPYVMIYDKENCDPIYRKLQRWCNSPMIFWSTKSFEEYDRRKG